MQLVANVQLTNCTLKIVTDETSEKYTLYTNIYINKELKQTKVVAEKLDLASAILKNLEVAEISLTPEDLSRLEYLALKLNASIVRSTQTKVAEFKVYLADRREYTNDDLELLFGKIEVLSKEGTTGEVLIDIGNTQRYVSVEIYDKNLENTTLVTLSRIVDKINDSYAPVLMKEEDKKANRIYLIEYTYLHPKIVDIVHPYRKDLDKLSKKSSSKDQKTEIGGLAKKKLKGLFSTKKSEDIQSSEEISDNGINISIIPTETKDNKYGIMFKAENVPSESYIAREIARLNSAKTETSTVTLIEKIAGMAEYGLLATVSTLFTPEQYEVKEVNGVEGCIFFSKSKDRDRIINIIADIYYDSKLAQSVDKGFIVSE